MSLFHSKTATVYRAWIEFGRIFKLNYRHDSNYGVEKLYNFYHLHFKVKTHSSLQNGILHLELQMQSDTDTVCKRINRCVKQAISNADITDHYITVSF